MQNKRKTGKEQYYTPRLTTDYCFKVISDKVRLTPSTIKKMLWLEPAGGTGNFIESMISGGVPKDKIISFDIEPKHYLVNKTANFLDQPLNNVTNCITLTNPPFGRANKLSIPFFNKCAEVSQYIGFIVPKSWRKWSILNRLDGRFHLIHDEELGIDYEYPESKEKSNGKLSTIFQIYEKRDYLREIIKIEDRGYIKKVRPEEANVSLTIFGRNCGSVTTDFPKIKNTTKMFLKVDDERVIKILGVLDYGKFCKNVAFIEALSIQEINFLLNEYFDNKL